MPGQEQSFLYINFYLFNTMNETQCFCIFEEKNKRSFSLIIILTITVYKPNKTGPWPNHSSQWVLAQWRSNLRSTRRGATGSPRTAPRHPPPPGPSGGDRDSERAREWVVVGHISFGPRARGLPRCVGRDSEVSSSARWHGGAVPDINPAAAGRRQEARRRASLYY